MKQGPRGDNAVVRPESLEGDWNRLYSEFPDVYDAFAAVPHEPRPIEVVTEIVPLAGSLVVDVGSGTGRSTFDLARAATRVVGVEPNPAMRAVAEGRAVASGIENVSFVDGSASRLPCPDASVHVVACVTTSFWPPETVVPEFVAEAFRVLRPGGHAFVLDTAPGWYGGEFRDVLDHDADYERVLDELLAGAGFAPYDFETSQEYGTVTNAAETYGFIFGSAAIERLRERGQTRISWRWRIRHRRR